VPVPEKDEVRLPVLLPIIGSYQPIKSESGLAASWRKRNIVLSPEVEFSRASISSGENGDVVQFIQIY
jgi:hypothetical protein